MAIVWILLGLGGGLLVNYLGDVLPRTRRLVQPMWWPLKARKVRKYFSARRVILVQCFFLVAALFINQRPPLKFSAFLFFILLIYFGVVTVIDVEHRVVMHPVSLAGALLLGGVGLWRHGFVPTLLGGLVAFGFMLALFFAGEWLGRLLARRRGEKWEETALGFGDVNLAGVIGLLMGWPVALEALLLGIVAAGVFSFGYLLVMLLTRRYRVLAAIPYAPFLCLGAVVMIAASIYSF